MGSRTSNCRSLPSPDYLASPSLPLYSIAKQGDLKKLKFLHSCKYDVHDGEQTLITALNHGHLEMATWLYKIKPSVSLGVMFQINGLGLQTLMKLQEKN